MLCDIPLAAFDTSYAAIYRGQSLFFPSGTVDTVRLRDGLAKLVNSTPILAGTLQYDTSRPGGWLKVGAPWWSADEILNIVDNTSRVDYATARAGNFAPDTIAEDFNPKPYFALPPQPVMRAQVNIVRGGVAFAVFIHHATCDAQGCAAVLRAWAALCRGEVVAPLSADRGVFGTGEGAGREEDHPEYARPQLATSLLPSTAILWYFSEQALAALKARANVDGNVGISTHVALCAFIWQRVVAASPAEDPNMAVNMLNAVDSRRRMNPTIPSNWLGNAVSIAHARSTARELLSAPLSRTAQLIRTSIEDMTAARILDAVALLNRQPELAMSPALAFSTWARLDTYELDWGTAFGGTRCERIRVYWAPPPGMVFIFPMGANGPSDKGVEVMLHLTPEDAAALDKDPTFAKYASKVY
ncbi:transferase-domain-containing protein [Exidia glandulosa HHB12029]|uniref:Transferase-domain-containing protein n=1 Tax=Exidia glandulosa HHB12029 TaxID=1314781 RepID=A0A165C8F5_EXIGL|nr:transferase-domain-containing protein [Exidia glandulosa HHB12029]